MNGNQLMHEQKSGVAERDTLVGYIPTEFYTYVSALAFDGDALTTIGRFAGDNMLILAGATDYGWEAIGEPESPVKPPPPPPKTHLEAYNDAVMDFLDIENQIFGEDFTMRGVTNKTIASNTKETLAMEMAGYVQGNAITITILPPNKLGMGEAKPKVNEKILMRGTTFIIRQVQQNESGHSFTLILEQINEQDFGI